MHDSPRQAAGLDVLLVEDDQVFGSIALDMLGKGLRDGEGGYRPVHPTIRWAQTLKEATEALSVRRPQVVILDLHLPDSRGTETFSNIRRVTTHVPVVVLTGRPAPGTSIEAACSGAEFLEKDAATRAAVVRAVWMAITRAEAA